MPCRSHFVCRLCKERLSGKNEDIIIRDTRKPHNIMPHARRSVAYDSMSSVHFDSISRLSRTDAQRAAEIDIFETKFCSEQNTQMSEPTNLNVAFYRHKNRVWKRQAMFDEKLEGDSQWVAMLKIVRVCYFPSIEPSISFPIDVVEWKRYLNVRSRKCKSSANDWVCVFIAF